MGKPHGVFLLSFLGLTISKVCLFPKFPMHFWSLQHGIMLTDKPEDYHSSGNSRLCTFFFFFETISHTTPVFFAWKIPWTEEPGKLQCPWGLKESHMTEWLLFTHSEFCYYVTVVPFMFVWKCNVPRWITHLIHFLAWGDKGLHIKKCSFEVQVIILKENLIYCQQYKKYNNFKVSARIEGKEAWHKGHRL